MKTASNWQTRNHTVAPLFNEHLIINFNAKKACNYMSRFIIQSRLTNPEDTKAFNVADYAFNPDLSSSSEFVFTH